MNGKLRAHGCVVLAVLALGGSAPCADGRDAEDAYADMSNTLGTVRLLPVRGRIVEEQDPVDVTRTTPGSQKSQEEFDHARVSLALVPATGARTEVGPAQADEEGYLDARLDLAPYGLSPGRYRLEVSFDGRAIGSSTARLLALDHGAPVIRSDVDLTYLQTDFRGQRAIRRLLRQDATERTVLPAMDIVGGRPPGDQDPQGPADGGRPRGPQGSQPLAVPARHGRRRAGRGLLQPHPQHGLRHVLAFPSPPRRPAGGLSSAGSEPRGSIPPT